jgi:hypothetical protein
MKRRHKRAKGRLEVVYVWSHEQAKKALPYITSVMKSLREHWLEAQSQRRKAEHLAALPGRADRATLIAHEEAVAEARRAQERFDTAQEELLDLNLFCLDPVQGLALIPFAHENQLAWFVFDLFDEGTLRSWRYHSDPLETRRPVAEDLPNSAADSLIV